MAAMKLVAFLVLLVSEPHSAVRYLSTEIGRCSMVVTGHHRALTAAHCGVGTAIGPDLSEIRGNFSAPYARFGAAPTEGVSVLLEGWGCEPRYITAEFTIPVLSIRGGKLLSRLPWAGMELGLYGRVCPGDSGGAVWADGGGLIGIITARGTNADSLAFATLPEGAL